MSSFPPIGSSIIEFDQIDSTNDYAMQLANEGSVEHGTVICTNFQTKGKGQQGKFWHAEKEKNLLLSFILDTSKEDIQSQFLLNAAFCSGIAHTLMEDYELASAVIKWPNDLFIGKKKIAGTLIENVIRGHQWQYAIVGIGINVNQVNFPEDISATSLCKELKREISLVAFRKKLIGQLNRAYLHYKRRDLDLIGEYNSLLHGFGEFIHFEKEGKMEKGLLKGADNNGFLNINEKLYRHGEIKLFL